MKNKPKDSIATNLRTRMHEISAEYWREREVQSERVAVAQLCLALARVELMLWEAGK